MLTSLLRVWIDGEENVEWIECKYERLWDIYFKCGRIDHTSTTHKYEHEKNYEKGGVGYGPWLKASG